LYNWYKKQLIYYHRFIYFLYFYKKIKTMKVTILLLKSMFLILLSSAEISKGQRRRSLVQAKKTLKSARLF
jgi:hypothetical protein